MLSHGCTYKQINLYSTRICSSVAGGFWRVKLTGSKLGLFRYTQQCTGISTATHLTAILSQSEVIISRRAAPDDLRMLDDD